jgi:1-phosphofructokinase
VLPSRFVAWFDDTDAMSTSVEGLRSDGDTHEGTEPASEVSSPVPAGGSSEEPSVAVFAPALLLLVELHRGSDGLDDVHLHAGGQGYWISRMIQALGARAVPCAAVGGEPGVVLRAIVAADGFDARLAAMTHANSVIVEDRRGAKRAVVSEVPVPALGRHEVDELYSAIVGAAMAAGVCVLAGTQLAPMFDPDTFRRLVADLRRNDIRIVVDLCGDPLRAALAGGVDVVKLSHEELIADGWALRNTTADITRGIRRLRAAGARAVVISRQHRSTLASDGERVVTVKSPKLEVLDGRGGGDSMTAALAVSMARSLTFEDGLRLAAAAAALNVSRHGLGTGRRDSIEDIARRVEIVPTVVNPTRVDLETMSKAELHRHARELEIPGRSTMTRKALIDAITPPSEAPSA